MAKSGRSSAALRSNLPLCLVAAALAAVCHGAAAELPADMPQWPAELADESGMAAPAPDSDPNNMPGDVLPTVPAEIPPAYAAVRAVSGQAENREAFRVPASGAAPARNGGSHDPVTAQQMEILRSTGLIARQSAIAESIIIMERQLRQAELIRDLMEVYGPHAPIEIAPGVYKSFADTPAGRKIAADIEEEEALSRIRLLELEAAEAALTEIGAPDAEFTQAGIEFLAGAAPGEEMPDWPELLEILGTGGEFRATFLVDGASVTAAEGDMLPDGSRIVSVSGNSARLENGAIEHEIRLGW